MVADGHELALDERARAVDEVLVDDHEKINGKIGSVQCSCISILKLNIGCTIEYFDNGGNGKLATHGCPVMMTIIK